MDKQEHIKKLEKEIYLLSEEEYKKKLMKSEDKIKWVFGIPGSILSCSLINAMYEIFYSNRIDNITRVFFLVGFIGIGMVVYSLKREKEQEKYIYRIQEEIRQKRKELEYIR